MATAPILPEVEEPAEIDEEVEPTPLDNLMLVAQSEGDISHIFSAQELTKIGADVVTDYERDDGDREDWKKIVKDALEKAAQGQQEVENDLPEYRASQVNFPILTVAAMQFHARAYPAICKSGNMVKIKVIGSDKGRPVMGPDGKQAVTVGGQVMSATDAAAMMEQQAPQPGPEGAPPEAQPAPEMPPPEPAWQIPPGAKAKRAGRVSDYMNVYLEYRMDDWEADTDAMLMQMPVAGDGFRKVWWANGKEHAAYIPALNVVVPKGAKSLKTTPRITEEIPDVYPYQIRQRQKSGEYRAVNLTPLTEDEEAPRLLLEQHRLMDMDGDGLDEPYIITVDKETSQVLKIEANFGPDSIEMNDNGPVSIERGQFFVNYPFLPDPKGGFYGIGLGHLLHQVGDIIDTTINQMFDAGHAQIAGGGFFASGLRLQGNGQTNTLRWRPGEYKNVNVSGQSLREGIYERTFPAPSAIMFNLLELVLGSAKDIAGIKDVLSGDAGSATMPVGTVMALIDQGLAVSNDIFKRVFRQLGVEFGLHYANLGKYGGQAVAEDYDKVLDDPEADFAKDFGETDMDIRPAADPSSVTKMQRMAKAQFIQQTGTGNPAVDQRVMMKRVYEAADVEDIDELIPPTNPNAPPPPEVMKTMSEVEYNKARTDYTQAQTAKLGFDVGKDTGLAEHGDPPEPPTAEAVPDAA